MFATTKQQISLYQYAISLQLMLVRTEVKLRKKKSSNGTSSLMDHFPLLVLICHQSALDQQNKGHIILLCEMGPLWITKKEPCGPWFWTLCSVFLTFFVVGRGFGWG